MKVSGMHVWVNDKIYVDISYLHGIFPLKNLAFLFLHSFLLVVSFPNIFIEDK